MTEVRTSGEATRDKGSPLFSGVRRIASAGFLVHWLALFLFWLVLSGFFTGLHVSAGIACTFAVAFLTYEMQLLELSPVRPPHHLLTVPWPRIWSYIVWLLREIAIANWQVLKIVLDPKLPIDPAVIRFRSGLQTDLGKTTLANSITLTPGTITVQVDGDEFVVHALVGGEPVVAGLKEMEDRIKRALPGIEPEVVS